MKVQPVLNGFHNTGSHHKVAGAFVGPALGGVGGQQGRELAQDAGLVQQLAVEVVVAVGALSTSAISPR